MELIWEWSLAFEYIVFTINVMKIFVSRDMNFENILII